MQFATIALIILIILLPGFIFRTAYSQWGISSYRPVEERPLAEQIPLAIVISAILHAVWLSIGFAFGYPVNLNALLMILLGNFGKDSTKLESVLDSISLHPVLIPSYFISICLAALTFGVALKEFVRHFGLDLLFPFLRFNDNWFYLLTGEKKEFSDGEISFIRPKIPDGVFLTAIIAHEKEDYQYKGIITDYFYDKDGALDSVVLISATRRKLAAEDGTAKEFREDYLLLKYADMSAIWLSYVWLEKVS
jgi:hypothetical protein